MPTPELLLDEVEKNLTFADVLNAMHEDLVSKDFCVYGREGWNGKGMFVFIVPGSTFKVDRLPLVAIFPEGTEIQYQPHIDMKTANGTVVPWLISQTDALASDWIQYQIMPQEEEEEEEGDKENEDPYDLDDDNEIAGHAEEIEKSL